MRNTIMILDSLRRCSVRTVGYAELVTTLAVKPVSALTVLDDEVYVAQSTSHDIDVFDVDSLSLRRRMTIVSVQRTLLTVVSFGRAAGISVTDMTSCRRHNCLYVADECGGVVRRLDRTNAKQVTQWSVGGVSPAGLSMTNRSNILVCCSDSTSLRIYTPLGCPVCQINIQLPGVTGLVCSVQLACGSFVVICVTASGNRLACVCRNSVDLPDLIDSSGCPTYVALVGGRGGSQVWLAERGASAGIRMVQLPASRCVVKFPTVEVQEPDKMCWDENDRRLYVIDHGLLKVFRVRIKP